MQGGREREQADRRVCGQESSEAGNQAGSEVSRQGGKAGERVEGRQ